MAVSPSALGFRRSSSGSAPASATTALWEPASTAACSTVRLAPVASTACRRNASRGVSRRSPCSKSPSTPCCSIARQSSEGVPDASARRAAARSSPETSASSSSFSSSSRVGGSSSGRASRCPCKAARRSAERPEPSRTSLSTPAPRSASIHSTFPESAAACRGVVPSSPSVAMSGGAPAWRRARTQATEPDAAAAVRGARGMLKPMDASLPAAAPPADGSPSS
mmetsp:Transcript_26996/g.81715  ORF Transcript_26996/g.81715 Transcript_26996/m.81715 type:complete len:224 (+) Transcript_26996:718-1389(+)